MPAALTPIQAAELAHLLADRAVVCDIESESYTLVDPQGVTWYDTRPMRDPREVPDDFAEMARQAIDYALHRGLVAPHPQHAYLLRITPSGRAL